MDLKSLHASFKHLQNSSRSARISTLLRGRSKKIAGVTAEEKVNILTTGVENGDDALLAVSS